MQFSKQMYQNVIFGVSNGAFYKQEKQTYLTHLIYVATTHSRQLTVITYFTWVFEVSLPQF